MFVNQLKVARREKKCGINLEKTHAGEQRNAGKIQDTPLQPAVKPLRSVPELPLDPEAIITLHIDSGV